jgi:hypothetical protein
MMKKCTPYSLIPSPELIQTLLSEEANLDEVLIEISSIEGSLEHAQWEGFQLCRWGVE